MAKNGKGVTCLQNYRGFYDIYQARNFRRTSMDSIGKVCSILTQQSNYRKLACLCPISVNSSTFGRNLWLSWGRFIKVGAEMKWSKWCWLSCQFDIHQTFKILSAYARDILLTSTKYRFGILTHLYMMIPMPCRLAHTHTHTHTTFATFPVSRDSL